MSDFHDFSERLVWSVSSSVTDFWLTFYRKAFPTATQIEDCQNDRAMQRLGIDRRVHLPCGRKVKIDEKTRERAFDDILLEYLSVDSSGKKGWIEKELGIDYFAYGILAKKRVYLLPYDLLCRAWQENRAEWLTKAKAHIEGFSHIIAQNRDYQTHSVCVPRAVLFTALIDAASFDLETDAESDPFAEHVGDYVPFPGLTLFTNR